MQYLDKNDLRLHAGQCIRFDFQEEIARISNLAATAGFDCSPPSGWYIGNKIVLQGHLNYLIENPLQNRKRVNGNIYDQNKKLVLKKTHRSPILRPYPTDNPTISSSVTGILSHAMTAEQQIPTAMNTSRNVITWDKLVIGHFCPDFRHLWDYDEIKSADCLLGKQGLIFQYSEDTVALTKAGRALFDTFDEFMMGLDSIISDLESLARRIARHNPWMVFDYSIIGGILTVRAVQDWRVQQWNLLQAEKELENQDHTLVGD